MRHAFFLAMLLLSAALPARGGPKGGESPEEAFKAMADAHVSSGARGFMQFLTNDSRRALTGGMLTTLHRARAVLLEKDAKSDLLRDLDELMKRYAIDAAKLKTYVETRMDAKTPEAMIAALTTLGDFVKDGPAFVQDLGLTMRFDPPFELLPRGAVLKEVKKDGDAARGTMRWKLGEKETSETVHFRREAGLWRVDFLPTIRASFGKK